MPILGIDPAANVAEGGGGARRPDARRVLRRARRPARLVDEGKRAALVLGNNVLAQVPDLNDFVAGVEDPAPRRRDGDVRVPPPAAPARRPPVRHDLSRALLVLLARRRSPRSFAPTASRCTTSRSSGRTVARCASTRSTPAARTPSDRPSRSSCAARTSAGCARRSGTRAFAEGVRESKRALLELLIDLRREGRHVVGYGAPGKGNTLLNYCGIRTDLLDYTVDRNPYKHGLFTPGTHIPIHPPERIAETRPDYIVVLPWNLDRRDRDPARVRRRMGRAADRSDPVATILESTDAEKASRPVYGRVRGQRRRVRRSATMKVVIFCGGLGVRMGEADAAHPEADDRRRQPADPLAHHEVVRVLGAHDFILCLGYKGECIKEYFLNYNEALSNDFVLSNGGRDVELLGTRHLGLADHVRRHRQRSRRSPSGCSRSRPISATTSTSSPPMATA